ncbi:MAG: T9SS type A sorting domain-containing protein [Bacteroidia bacterium]|jgi:hypothetical protein|nr:T9SS type A sorting domain-containing protein [Bacteroidia bacterium]
MKLIRLIIAAASLLTCGQLQAAPGDTTHVTTHNQMLVVTNPNTGSNEYPVWAVFPAQSMNYRKVLVSLQMRCPTNQNCGEWDYIDRVMMRRKGGVNQPSLDLELVRFITPYGNTFTGTWRFGWEIDITDFAMLLHDSVEIGYQHTGYETNVGRGWIVTLDFQLVEGTPVLPPLGYQILLQNGGTYGGNPSVETVLTPDTVTMGPNTQVAKVRMNHTGHGADAQYCSEFCDKYRDLFIDGVNVERFQRWRKCGHNALFPQGGTWVYDRGNWCPGAMVNPNHWQFAVTPGSTHVINVDMEPYSGNGQANEVFTSYLFEYGAPSNANDAGIDEVMRPSTKYEFGRMNPICSSPVIILRNNGGNALTTATISYGFTGGPVFTYNWSGNLATNAVDTVDLGGVIIPPAGGGAFKAWITTVNGGADQYNHDDTITSMSNAVQGFWETSIYLELRTNNESAQENSYQLLDGTGNVVFSRALGTMTNNTTYRDTFNLQPGCYRLRIHDMDPFGGDGLSFWANSQGGSGYSRLRRVSNGGVIRSFPADFGSIIDYSFTVGIVNSVPEPNAAQIIADIYPNPSTNGQFTIALSNAPNAPVNVDVFDATGRLVHAQRSAFSNSQLQIDLGGNAGGMYFVKIVGEDFVISQRVMVGE